MKNRDALNRLIIFYIVIAVVFIKMIADFWAERSDLTYSVPNVILVLDIILIVYFIIQFRHIRKKIVPILFTIVCIIILSVNCLKHTNNIWNSIWFPKEYVYYLSPDWTKVLITEEKKVRDQSSFNIYVTEYFIYKKEVAMQFTVNEVKVRWLNDDSVILTMDGFDNLIKLE